MVPLSFFFVFQGQDPLHWDFQHAQGHWPSPWLWQEVSRETGIQEAHPDEHANGPRGKGEICFNIVIPPFMIKANTPKCFLKSGENENFNNEMEIKITRNSKQCMVNGSVPKNMPLIKFWNTRKYPSLDIHCNKRAHLLVLTIFFTQVLFDQNLKT